MSPRYEYSCATCGGDVTKTPCIKREEPTKEKGEKAKKSDYAGLGGWRCAKDGAGIQVKRELR